MKPGRALSVSKLRWGIAALSIYFAAIWSFLAGKDDYPAAFVVLGVGLFLGSGVLRLDAQPPSREQ